MTLQKENIFFIVLSYFIPDKPFIGHIRNVRFVCCFLVHECVFCNTNRKTLYSLRIISLSFSAFAQIAIPICFVSYNNKTSMPFCDLFPIYGHSISMMIIVIKCFVI